MHCYHVLMYSKQYQVLKNCQHNNIASQHVWRWNCFVAICDNIISDVCWVKTSITSTQYLCCWSCCFDPTDLPCTSPYTRLVLWWGSVRSPYHSTYRIVSYVMLVTSGFYSLSHKGYYHRISRNFYGAIHEFRIVWPPKLDRRLISSAWKAVNGIAIE